VKLLDTPGMGEWVRYKLDQATDHVLVDEAQDTNADQWAIVAALAGEFFAGESAKGRLHRTIFTVGDFKQAIFGFQGTDPLAFEAARIRFTGLARQAEREVFDLSLDTSFRSTPPILELVDKLIAELGSERLGLLRPADPHLSAHEGKPGRVTLWRPLSAGSAADLEDEGEEGWIDDATREFASRLARQIRQWIDERLWLAGKGRPIRPEDILVLVRKRGALASLIVARLHAEGVAVAGVDRLRLNAPLGVRDLLAAMRFAVQPDDDLTLASLLVSPLFGWSQEELYRVAHGRRGSLWRAVREDAPSAVSATDLGALLAGADFTTPYRFLETILSGPLDGRRKLLRRLGSEARDPIEELLGAALQFESDANPSLQRFLDWFDRGEVEIKRDPSAPADAVRVMTVHGAKGLQAPLVILADATGDPEASPRGVIDWELADGVRVPVFRPRKGELAGSLAEAVESAAAREEEEHWRLLYVALTRADHKMLHSLFERLPAIAPDRRAAAADRWLAGSAGVADGALRRALIEDACTIIADPAFAALFGPSALAEAPIAAVVGQEVVAGTVDRLLIEEGRILVVDFKTGRRVPASAEAAPEHHLRQMSAYAAALEVIFPGRRVEAALLYTAGPRLIALPAALVALHKQHLTA
jgi:ATP-dependent helicase/nuclease subunit A